MLLQNDHRPGGSLCRAVTYGRRAMRAAGGRARAVVQINQAVPPAVRWQARSLDLSWIRLHRKRGNMVCPGRRSANTGAALLSVPEGDDKVAKYPASSGRRSVLLTKWISCPTPFAVCQVEGSGPRQHARPAPADPRQAPGDAWLAWLRALVAG